jgi:hypothetical protein
MLVGRPIAVSLKEPLTGTSLGPLTLIFAPGSRPLAGLDGGLLGSVKKRCNFFLCCYLHPGLRRLSKRLGFRRGGVNRFEVFRDLRPSPFRRVLERIPQEMDLMPISA